MKTRSEKKRDAILEVAEKTFLELGYERTSMSEICARVGGSKSTLYNHFSSKEELFFEVMTRLTDEQFNAVHRALSKTHGNISESLRLFGEKFLKLLYSPQMMANRRLIYSEAERTDLGHIAYERRVKLSRNLIADFLQAAMAEKKLKQADPDVATRHLTSLLESELLDRLHYQLPGEVTPEEITAVTGRAIDVFMAAYGVN